MLTRKAVKNLMYRTRNTGYQRVGAITIGPRATEVVCSAVRYLLTESINHFTGDLVSVFDHTIHVTLPQLKYQDHSSLVVFGTSEIRDGPMLIQIDGVADFKSYTPPTGRNVRFQLNANNSALFVYFGDGMTVYIPLSMVPTLPAAGGIYKNIKPQHFRATGTAVSIHCDLIDRLKSDEITDGLGLLTELYQWHQGYTVKRLSLLISSFNAVLHSGNKTIPNPIEQLIGRGPGATPSGDDFLVGAILVLRLITSDLVGRQATWLANEVAKIASEKTTHLSAALLEQAARRRAAEPALRCVNTLFQRDADKQAVHRASKRLIETGHTSGVDCLTGILTMTTAVLPAIMKSPQSVIHEQKSN